MTTLPKPGSTVLSLMPLLLMLTLTAWLSAADVSKPLSRANVSRNVSGLKLPGAFFMEVVEETTCSNAIVRLTCRSLKAFMFILKAEYLASKADACDSDRSSCIRHSVKRTVSVRNHDHKVTWNLRRSYIDDDDDDGSSEMVDVRSSLNKRCSGLHHCRFLMTTDHPGDAIWKPANLQLKYACIPELAVRKYCNVHFNLREDEAGYLKSPGYPLYYTGEDTCGWIFKAQPGQKIMLTFHDLDIRGRERDGSCVDVVRVRDSGSTLYESCGTVPGVKVISSTNLLTLDLIASERLFPARGFFLEYQVLGCPDVSAPNGSYVSNGTLESRTFLCRSGTIFPDIQQRTRIILCKNGHWSEKVEALPGCVASWAVILKHESENERLSSLSGDSAGSTSGVRIGREYEGADANSTSTTMDPAQPAMIKHADYVVDIVLPTVLIALLFVGNAIIVYIIFQYRKRKTPVAIHNEEVALSSSSIGPQV